MIWRYTGSRVHKGEIMYPFAREQGHMSAGDTTSVIPALSLVAEPDWALTCLSGCTLGMQTTAVDLQRPPPSRPARARHVEAER